MRKTVDAVIVFKLKSNGTCRMRWNSFGYESLGGGAFSDEVKSWVKRDDYGHPYHLKLPGRMVDSGTEYEVDCAAFQ